MDKTPTISAQILSSHSYVQKRTLQSSKVRQALGCGISLVTLDCVFRNPLAELQQAIEQSDGQQKSQEPDANAPGQLPGGSAHVLPEDGGGLRGNLRGRFLWTTPLGIEKSRKKRKPEIHARGLWAIWVCFEGTLFTLVCRETKEKHAKSILGTHVPEPCLPDLQLMATEAAILSAPALLPLEKWPRFLGSKHLVNVVL